MRSSSSKLNIAVLVSGSGTNLQSIIDAVESGKLNAAIKVVISDNPEAYALVRAKKHGLETAVLVKDGLKNREDYDARLVDILNAAKVELVCLAGFMRILSPVMIRAYQMRIMNIHPSLLPSFVGLDVQKKAVDYGVKFSGCTVHFVTEGLDSGPIIIQAVVPLKDADTGATLASRILAEEHKIYPQAIKLYAEGRLNVLGRTVRIKDAEDADGSMSNPKVPW